MDWCCDVGCECVCVCVCVCADVQLRSPAFRWLPHSSSTPPGCTENSSAKLHRTSKVLLTSSDMVKGKEYHIYLVRSVGRDVRLPYLGEYANHSSLWRVASATINLRLPSQPQDIAALCPVPIHATWWQRHVCMLVFEQLVQGRYLAEARLEMESTASWVALTTIIPRGKHNADMAVDPNFKSQHNLNLNHEPTQLNSTYNRQSSYNWTLSVAELLSGVRTVAPPPRTPPPVQQRSVKSSTVLMP